MTTKQIKSLTARLEKVEALVAESAMFPISGRDGYYVVRNGDGRQFYGICVH